MTFQPPPPPPGGNPPPPPPPPPGQWGPPPGGASGPQKFDPKNVNSLDWGIIAAGVLAFIFSLFSYYTGSYGGLSVSTSAWHGFFGWAAALLAVVGAALVAMELFAPQVKLPVKTRLASLGCFAAATLFVIIALFTNAYDNPGIAGVDTGHGFGYWASLIVIVAGTVLALMRAQQTGTALPGALGNMPNIGSKGPQGGIGGPGGGTPPPPPPPPPAGYGQPPTP
jgi:hypothetical protein